MLEELVSSIRGCVKRRLAARMAGGAFVDLFASSVRFVRAMSSTHCAPFRTIRVACGGPRTSCRVVD